jgi:hypothetical protein
MTVRAIAKIILGPVALALLVACQAPQDGDPSSSGAPPAMPSSATSKDFGDFVVHFNALATDQLTAEVARSSGIVRSPNRAMLNISIIRKQDGTTGEPVPGSVAAVANNLTGQVKQITIREIREGSAIYYIGELTVANEEIITFNVDVTPAGRPDAFPTITFQKKFFTK